jgi:hypothetical protein
VDDVRDPVPVQRPVERGSVGDVATHDRNLGVGGEPQSVVRGAEIEADDLDVLRGELRAGPGADAPQRARDEEALVRHGST